MGAGLASPLQHIVVTFFCLRKGIIYTYTCILYSAEYSPWINFLGAFFRPNEALGFLEVYGKNVQGGIFAFDATLAIMLRSCQKYVAICQTYFGCSLPDHFRQRRETDIANQKQQKQRPDQWNRQTFNTQKDKIIVVD